MAKNKAVPPGVEVDELATRLLPLIAEATEGVDARDITCALTNLLVQLAKSLALPGYEVPVLLGIARIFTNEAERLSRLAPALTGAIPPRSAMN
jgi:hypothetical protein